MLASLLALLPSVSVELELAADVDVVGRAWDGIGSSWSNRELALETDRVLEGVARPEMLRFDRYDEATLAGLDEPGTAVGGDSLE